VRSSSLRGGCSPLCGGALALAWPTWRGEAASAWETVALPLPDGLLQAHRSKRRSALFSPPWRPCSAVGEAARGGGQAHAWAEVGCPSQLSRRLLGGVQLEGVCTLIDQNWPTRPRSKVQQETGEGRASRRGEGGEAAAGPEACVQCMGAAGVSPCCGRLRQRTEGQGRELEQGAGCSVRGLLPGSFWAPRCA